MLLNKPCIGTYEDIESGEGKQKKEEGRGLVTIKENWQDRERSKGNI